MKIEFKDRLRQLREEKGISAIDLVRYLGKSLSALRMWETARAHPDAATLIKIADFFNVSTDYLLGVSGREGTEFYSEYIKMVEIEAILSLADSLFSAMPQVVRDAIDLYHNEHATVNYCLRWGLQAVQEVIRDWSALLTSNKEDINK